MAKRIHPFNHARDLSKIQSKRPSGQTIIVTVGEVVELAVATAAAEFTQRLPVYWSTSASASAVVATPSSAITVDVTVDGGEEDEISRQNTKKNSYVYALLTYYWLSNDHAIIKSYLNVYHHLITNVEIYILYIYMLL
jgi:hypothetical protein